MTWQDIVFSVGQLVMTLALLPTIFDSRGKPPIKTSALTTMILLVFGFTFTTLLLWFSAMTSLLGATAWCVIGIQRYCLNSNR